MPVAVLILLATNAPEEARARILHAAGPAARITATLPPRLLIAEIADPAAITALPGIAAITDGSTPIDPAEPLTDTEQLFADAFVHAHAKAAAARNAESAPGAGLPWDAPGYTPPG